MADQPDKAGKKRRVRNPETFRERAVKAGEEPEKTSSASKLKLGAGKIVNPVAKPVGKGLGKAFNRKPFTWLKKPLRLIGRILLPVYLRNSWRELRKVHWPSRRESFRLTFAVLLFALVFGAVIAAVDFGLDKIFRNVLLK